MKYCFGRSTIRPVDLEPTHHTDAIAAALTQLEPYFFKSPQQQIIAQFSFFEWGQQIQQMESKWWCSSLLLKHCKNSSHKSQQYEIISGGSFLVSSTSVTFRFRFFSNFRIDIKTPHENAGATNGEFSVDNKTLIHCLRKICHPNFLSYYYQNRSICMH